MPYSFVYDLNKITQTKFNQLIETAYKTGVTRILTVNVKNLVKLFKLDKMTGLNLAEAITELGFRPTPQSPQHLPLYTIRRAAHDATALRQDRVHLLGCA
ncbi:MAG: hypothetical protein P8X91_09405 [Candidatus Bathyarchaeota archaeon]